MPKHDTRARAKLSWPVAKPLEKLRERSSTCTVLSKEISINFASHICFHWAVPENQVTSVERKEEVLFNSFQRPLRTALMVRKRDEKPINGKEKDSKAGPPQVATACHNPTLASALLQPGAGTVSQVGSTFSTTLT
eukprot:TRINITY_DN9578_c0_g1_i1.p1 TRINITY_DN9578_c0_g1~~TRINITY_DN9578_c0_g1_i1.p1  ORF type:complete len:136 (+),score=11.64 TRINITY_DN9578_c0_g1_i1:55-462(+)